MWRTPNSFRDLPMRLLTARLSAAAAVLSLVPSLAHATAPATDVAWDLVRDLTTQIGPRPAGSLAEARAREWAAARLKTLGFQKVAIEPFTMRAYRRGTDKAELVGFAAQPLAITALGYSGATPEAGITAPLVYFPRSMRSRPRPTGRWPARSPSSTMPWRRRRMAAATAPMATCGARGRAWRWPRAHWRW
jgi:hypothetical protein